jgi:hypothetical protein
MPQAQLKLSTTAIAIYVVLMSKSQAIGSNELAESLGIKKLDSDALKQLRTAELIDVGKVGRSNTYTVSRTGWARCLDVMGAPAIARGSAQRALLALLQGLKRGFLFHTEFTPEQFFAQSDGPGPATAEQLVRRAYAQLARTTGDWVPLASIRDYLAQLQRGDLDRALESLALQPGVHLIPWDNRKALTDRDRAASLRFGGDDNHALRIESA